MRWYSILALVGVGTVDIEISGIANEINLIVRIIIDEKSTTY
jgi:hypothetical protein